jgi:phosphoglycolate phosphatase-like HAD superfamily hydrolase
MEELQLVAKWSARVNELAPEACLNLTAFPYAVKVIRKLYDLGVDISAVSGTPEAHIITQLKEYGILDCFSAIFAQQAGKKSAALTTIMVGKCSTDPETPYLNSIASHYDLCCMFGDAPKDYEEARKANKALSGDEHNPVRMYFIEAGRENETWENFYKNIVDQFIAGTWSYESEQALIKKGMQNLNRLWDPNSMPIDSFAFIP